MPCQVLSRWKVSQQSERLPKKMAEKKTLAMITEVENWELNE